MPDRAVTAVVDSGQQQGYAAVQAAVIHALEHMRVPLRVADLAGDGLAAQLAPAPAVIVIGQSGLAGRLAPRDVEALRCAVQDGVGLVNFDGELAVRCPDLLQPAIEGVAPAPTAAAAAILTAEKHFVTATRRAQRLLFFSPVRCWPGAPATDAAVVMEDDTGGPLVIAAAPGEGRIVHFCCEPALWTFDHLGHGGGLDDVFWRSIVWAARKPFAMLAMPPFVTARIDDASGSGSAYAGAADSAARGFDYIDELNRHGFVPNVGLFIDDISADDGALIRAKWAAKQAQFSPHAFRDPGNVEFQIYLRHDGAEYSEAELRDNFARVDAHFAQWEISPARTLNSHYDEIGVNALPFLRERGWMYMMTEPRFGKAFADPEARAYWPRPHGHFGCILDEMPEFPEFFNALSEYVPPAGYHPSVDFLSGHTVFGHESQQSDLAGAVEHGAAMIARGLDNLMFGVLMAHEQRIASLSSQEWRTIMHGIARELEPYEKIFVPYDEVSAYARARHRVELTRVSYLREQGTLECATAGEVDRELLLHVFTEEQGEVVRTFHRLPAGRDVVFQLRM